ncbi:hypothetical protein PaeCFBP13512_23035 [Paenibacillus sp. CFBP13512]|uniref:hypothetical protein n=1 Tax=Paenibacillus sp. CFBP13512 TaxID=2184007 RepID=UPI0010C095DE|nr:hypothetical protein [Paenibacillus sp. CFBP13512]TKJ83303.1 hypothetical protein PaeCFBP13512_23035 [Paenibacillus sp. CFBP13512]
MNEDFILSLKPLGSEVEDKELFIEYKKRIGHLLPNFPECALENWIYRHHSDIDDYAFLDFQKMKFQEKSWSKDEIFNNIKSYESGMIDNLGYHIYESDDPNWLQKYMLTHNTWNVPIIVFQNDSPLNIPIIAFEEDFPDMGKPYHLLEGHLRLNYFREMYRKEKERLNDNHKLWLVTI